LLVAVEARVVRLLDPIEHGGDGAQASDIGLDVAPDLELEPPVPVARDDLFERLGQSVIDPMFDVAQRHRVEQSDGVPRGDPVGGSQAGQEARMSSRSNPGTLVLPPGRTNPERAA
jgi:hypothetical protein